MTDAAPAAPPSGRRRIGEVLVAEEVLSEEQLARALRERMITGGRRERLGQAIVRLGLASASDIARALAQQLGLRYLPGDHLPVDHTLTAVVSPGVAQRHGVVPLRRDPDGTLYLASADPTDIVALDDVRLATGARMIVPVVATGPAIEAALRKAYGFDQRAGELIDAIGPDGTDPEVSELELAGSAGDAPIVRLAEGVLVDAVHARASDIHIEPGSTDTAVRYRTDGVLHTVMKVPRAVTPALVSRLKIMSGMDIAERRRPQDGRAKITTDGNEVDFRVSILPSLYGETMVLRLLRKGAERLELADVGFDDEQRARVLNAVDRPQGLVLITGPTGSGKTSTLYAFLAQLANETRNIVTLEDPVEYRLDGVNQTQVNEGIGLSFARCLRTVLRQDPDVVMVGEIRDPETAELGLQASLTGHLVLSTLHTNDAPAAIVRLRDLGIPSYLVSSSLSLVVAQRLVRTICRGCTRPSRPSAALAAQLHLSARDVERGDWREGAGCAACNATGYRGRLGLFEILPVDGRVRELLATDATESALRRAARAAGMRSLREDGLAKALAGLTTLDEVLRVTPTDIQDDGVCPNCAGAIEDDFTLCPWCGAQLAPPACNACERPLAHGWKLCPACGTAAQPTTQTGSPPTAV